MKSVDMMGGAGKDATTGLLPLRKLFKRQLGSQNGMKTVKGMEKKCEFAFIFLGKS